ncbi:MAG: terpene cyclase/mutase family protein [Planctomycetaceae bacterium]|nr:terpene cyclase/mutase family protein [Planctomycetaceae bacterium]
MRSTIGRCLLGGAVLLLSIRPAAGQEAYDPEAVDNAIARALDYLAGQQAEEGFWRTDAWGESTAITSLAVMAFLSAGHVPDEGPYGKQVAKGVRWVVSQQQPNGMFVHKNHSHGPMYSHGICTLMIAEAAGMVPGPDATAVRRALENGIRLILEAQTVNKYDRHKGGWRYQIDSRDSDLSVTGWQVMALRAAKDIGCDVPVESIEAAIDYVKQCSVHNNAGFGYQPGNGATPTLTGTGIACLEVCGAHHTEETLGGAEWLVKNPLQESSSYFYYGVYYTGVGMFKVGGDPADANKRHLAGILLPIQEEDGSWIPKHGSEKNAGKVYATSLSVLGLAIDYRYLPIYQR